MITYESAVVLKWHPFIAWVTKLPEFRFCCFEIRCIRKTIWKYTGRLLSSKNQLTFTHDCMQSQSYSPLPNYFPFRWKRNVGRSRKVACVWRTTSKALLGQLRLLQTASHHKWCRLWLMMFYFASYAVTLTNWQGNNIIRPTSSSVSGFHCFIGCVCIGVSVFVKYFLKTKVITGKRRTRGISGSLVPKFKL